MDLVFTCPNCRQELEADAAGAGTEINCPECGFAITIPEAMPQNIRAIPAVGTPAAAAQKERHFKVPVSDKKAKIDIDRPRPSLDMAAKGLGKKPMIKCFRNADYADKGPGEFAKAVSEFLESVGDGAIISLSPIHYSHLDPLTNHVLQDYGVMIYYKG